MEYFVIIIVYLFYQVFYLIGLAFGGLTLLAGLVLTYLVVKSAIKKNKRKYH